MVVLDDRWRRGVQSFRHAVLELRAGESGECSVLPRLWSQAPRDRQHRRSPGRAVHFGAGHSRARRGGPTRSLPPLWGRQSPRCAILPDVRIRVPCVGRVSGRTCASARGVRTRRRAAGGARGRSVRGQLPSLRHCIRSLDVLLRGLWAARIGGCFCLRCAPICGAFARAARPTGAQHGRRCGARDRGTRPS